MAAYPVAPVVVGSAAPAVVAPAAKVLPAPAANAASVIIKAPTDATVRVDGQEIRRSAAEETFSTPSLEADRAYEYVFKAQAVRDGKTVTLTRRVTVQAGQQSEADFSELGSAPVADVARVAVAVPEGAKLYVNDVECPASTSPRTFTTPKLEPGKQYYYTVRAEMVKDGQTETESRRIIVEAGKLTTVEFKDVAGTQAARR